MNFRKKGGRNDEFSEKGGGHSNPKNFVADFSTPEKKRNIVFRNEGRVGGSEAVWKFSENSSKMVHTIVPKYKPQR